MLSNDWSSMMSVVAGTDGLMPKENVMYHVQMAQTVLAQQERNSPTSLFVEKLHRVLQQDDITHESIACDNEQDLREILFGSFADSDWARAHQCSCQFDDDLGGRWVLCTFIPSCPSSSSNEPCIDHADAWLFDDEGSLQSATVLLECTQNCGGYTDHSATVYFDKNNRQTCAIVDTDDDTVCTNCWFEGTIMKYKCAFTGSDTNEIDYGDAVHPFLDEEEQARVTVLASDESDINTTVIAAVVAVVVVVLVALAIVIYCCCLKNNQGNHTPVVIATPHKIGEQEHTVSTSHSYPIQTVPSYPVNNNNTPNMNHPSYATNEQSYAVDL